MDVCVELCCSLYVNNLLFDTHGDSNLCFEETSMYRVLLISGVKLWLYGLLLYSCILLVIERNQVNSDMFV